MKKYLWALVPSLLILILTSCATPGFEEKYPLSDFVLKDANVIPMTGEFLMEETSVYIHDGKIKSIGNFKDLSIPPHTRVLDCRGKYLVPGFCDMHMHMSYIDEGDLCLANGVTLIRNMAGNPGLLGFKKAVMQRDKLGPEFHTVSPILDGEGARWYSNVVITEPHTVPEIIKGYKDEGYESIKVYDELTLEVYDAIIASARKENIPVVGHVPHRVGLNHVLDSGQFAIEHFNGFDPTPITEETISKTVSSGVWISTALGFMDKIERIEDFHNSDIPELKYVHPNLVAWWKTFHSYDFFNYENNKKNLKILYDRGAHFVAGTDAGNPYVIPGFSLHEELQLMNDSGLSPYEVLLTATVNPAKMLGIEERLGTIEPGKDADLVLLEKNPLNDISNTKSISGVMTKGFWLSREDLQGMLEEIEKSH